MTTFRDHLRQFGGVPVASERAITGSAVFVRPYSGSDANRGNSPDKAVKTVAKAITLVDNANFGRYSGYGNAIFIVPESNTAASTTDYQSSTLTFSVDGISVIGLNGGQPMSQRSRIAQLSTATGVAPLVTVSSNGSVYENIQFFHGVDDATSIGCVSVTGDGNVFRNCHFAGIGHATMDAANGYSLLLSGSEENLFENCVIGLDTISRGGATNTGLQVSVGADSSKATRNIFRNCTFLCFGEANTATHIIVDSGAVDRFLLFDGCTFIGQPTGYITNAVTLNQVCNANATQNGLILFKNCVSVGATAFATTSGKSWFGGQTGGTVDVKAGGLAVQA